MDKHRASEKPEISVVIPIYNVEKFLRACIDSVLRQTYQDFELILVDDGATDSSPAICDDYARQYDNVFVIHQKNGGLSAARNSGLSSARGSYVYFLDSDDWLVCTALQELVDIAMRENADAVLFDACVVDETGKPIYHSGYTDYYSRKMVYNTIRTGRRLFSELLQNGDYLPAVPLMLMRRESVTIPFKPILHEDELFTPQFLYTIERACTCGRSLYVRRVRAHSITSEQKTRKHFIGMATAAKGLLSFAQADDVLKNYAVSLALSALSIYNKISNSDRAASKDTKQLLIKTLLQHRSPRALAAAALLALSPVYGLLQAVKRGVPHWMFALNANLRDRKRFLPALKKIKNMPPKQKRILVIGSPEHGNLGDHAITLAQMRFFQANFPAVEVVDISMPFYRAYRSAIVRLAQKTDLIVVSGGGWLGNVWYHNEKSVLDIVKRFPKNRVIILPQTIWYQPSIAAKRQIARARKTYCAHKGLTIFLRERESLALAKTLCADARYCPDMCLYLDERKPEKRDGVLLCFRQDREKTLDDDVVMKIEDALIERGIFFRHTTTVLQKNVSATILQAALEKKLGEIRRARFVVTDRLHAVLFSMITGTPCIAFDNLTKKVSGVLSDCGIHGGVFFAASEAEALLLLDELLQREPDNAYTPPSFAELVQLFQDALSGKQA